jgi:hypothetical protein
MIAAEWTLAKTITTRIAAMMTISMLVRPDWLCTRAVVMLAQSTRESYSGSTTTDFYGLSM